MKLIVSDGRSLTVTDLPRDECRHSQHGVAEYETEACMADEPSAQDSENVICMSA
jgi:hypothetical protein